MRNWSGWLGLCRVIAALAVASSASATDVVSFDAPGVSLVQQGALLNVNVGFAFDDLTLGGGFDLNFSPDLFAFKKFDFAVTLGDDPAFRAKPADDSSASPLTIAFGSFSGLTGIKQVGILQLLAKETLVLGSGPVLLSAVDNVSPSGPFVDANAGHLPVQYTGLRGTVVPEPNTVVLVAIGLVGIGAARRRSGSIHRDDR